MARSSPADSPIRVSAAHERVHVAVEELLGLIATEYAVLYELAVRARRVLGHGLLLQWVLAAGAGGRALDHRRVIHGFRAATRSATR